MPARSRKPEPLDGAPDLGRSRVLLTLTSSYGISLLLHAILLLVFASIVIFCQDSEAVPLILPRLERREVPHPDELDRGPVDRPPDPRPEVPGPPAVDVGEPPPPATVPPQPLVSADPSAAENVHPGLPLCGVGPGNPRWPGGPGGNGNGDGGGTGGTEDAVFAALRWLARHQSPDGRWDADGFAASCAPDAPCSGPSNAPGESGRGPGAGYAHYDAGVTGLATLAFLGHGITHQFGPAEFRVVVRSAIAWLAGLPGLGTGIQWADGSIGFDPAVGETIYNHAMATIAICEAYALTHDPVLRPKAEAAVRFCLRAQNPGYGWRYGVAPGDNDTSVTGWMVLALKAARVAGIEVPQAAFDGARTWFDRATLGIDTATGRFPNRTVERAGEVGYMAAGDGGSYLEANGDRYEGLPTMTAVAVLCRIFTGQRRSDDVLQDGAAIIEAHPPTWGTGLSGASVVNLYYWYYGTYAMFQMGGPDWLPWNQAMQQALLPTQRTSGCEDGSWDPVDEWGVAGGRVYATAIAALTLEIYYRYERAQGGAGGR